MTLDLAELYKALKNEELERKGADQNQQKELAGLNTQMGQVVDLLGDIKKGLIGDEYTGPGLISQFEELKKAVVTKEDMKDFIKPYDKRITKNEGRLTWGERALMGMAISQIVGVILFLVTKG